MAWCDCHPPDARRPQFIQSLCRNNTALCLSSKCGHSFMLDIKTINFNLVYTLPRYLLDTVLNCLQVHKSNHTNVMYSCHFSNVTITTVKNRVVHYTKKRFWNLLSYEFKTICATQRNGNNGMNECSAVSGAPSSTTNAQPNRHDASATLWGRLNKWRGFVDEAEQQTVIRNSNVHCLLRIHSPTIITSYLVICYLRCIIFSNV